MFDRESIKADVKIETFDVPVSAYGNVDTRRKDITGAVTFRPCGELTANILGALYPHGTPAIGINLFGSVDVPCLIHSLAGTKVTFAAAALTKMPSLKLSTLETAFGGDAEITAVGKNNVSRTTDGSFYEVAAAIWTGAFDVANLKGGVYTGVWGGGETPITFKTAAGWTIDFDMQVQPQYCDGVGTYDLVLQDVKCRAKCVPIGVNEATILGYLNPQGSGAVMGGSMRSGKDLVISCATGLTVTLKDAAMVTGPLEWGNDKLRVGEIGFVAHRVTTNGLPGALFSVALTA